MDRPHLPWLTDNLIAEYNLFLTLLWVPYLSGPAYVPWIVAAHLAATTLPFWFERRPLSGWAAILRDSYPVAMIATFWSEVDLHSALIDTAPHDARIAALDRALFGIHLHETWPASMPWPWLNTLMQGSYFAYYFLIAGVPLIVLSRRNRAAIREMVWRGVIGYLACFACYMVFPVNGPDGTFPLGLAQLTHDPFYRLNAYMRAGDSLGSSFPSSHVAASIALAWIAWRFGRPWQAAMAITIASMICLATVYTANHFAVDSLAGIMLGLLVQLVATWAIRPATPLATTV